MTVDERARAGLFLAMQYPVEVPGVSVSNFLRTAATAVRGEAPKLRTWVKEVNAAMAALEMDKAFAERSVNEGFSGGEKKRHEILQLELLKPKIAILDETDSGLDVDALRVVSEGVNRVRETGIGTLLITHYTRILRYIEPDFVHVFFDGRIVESGGAELADRLEAEGYARFGVNETACRRKAMTAMTFDVEAVRKDFPILTREVHGVPLVYLDSANSAQKPQVVHRRRGRPLRQPLRQRRPRGAHPRVSEVTTRLRGRPRQGGGVPQRAQPRRGHLHQQHHRGAEPAGLLVLERRRRSRAPSGSGSARATRSSSPRWSTTATSCRGSCSRSAPARRSGGSRSTTTAAWSTRPIDEVINERTKVVVVRLPVQRARHDQPGARASSPGPRRSARCRSSTPRRPRRTCRSTCRRSAPTSSRSPGTSSTARPASACSGAATTCSPTLPPFLGGGEMIETVDDDRLDVRRAAASLRGRHADDRPGRRAGRGRRLRHRARHGEHPRRTSTRSPATRSSSCRRSPGCASSARPTPVDRGATISFALDGHPPARRRPAARRAGHRGARRASLRPAGLRALRNTRRPPERHSVCTRRRTRSTPWSRGVREGAGGVRSERCSMDSMYQEIILDHYKHPQHRGLLDAVRRRGAPRQPDLRRRGDAAGARWPTARSPTSAGTARAARSARPRPR